MVGGEPDQRFRTIKKDNFPLAGRTEGASLPRVFPNPSLAKAMFLENTNVCFVLDKPTGPSVITLSVYQINLNTWLLVPAPSILSKRCHVADEACYREVIKKGNGSPS